MFINRIKFCLRNVLILMTLVIVFKLSSIYMEILIFTYQKRLNLILN